MSYCSIAELYLTDLCYDDNAEQLCEESILKSLEIIPNNLHASQTYASFRVSQQRMLEAADMLEILYIKTKAMRDAANMRTLQAEMKGEDGEGDGSSGILYNNLYHLYVMCIHSTTYNYVCMPYTSFTVRLVYCKL